MTRTCIPKKQRKEMSVDPEYSSCALAGYFNHECEGRITWEHAIIFAGKSYQAKWAILPLCAKAHAVDFFQDAGTMKKEVNIWIAVNRATDDELRAVSKAINYISYRERLNQKYGIWKPKIIFKT